MAVKSDKATGNRRNTGRLTDAEQRARYEAHRGEIALYMSHLTVNYLRMVHKAFGGDLTLAIVLGEIAHHSMVHYFPARGLDPRYVGRLTPEAIDRSQMPSCSASALARATGLPRETVRRKLVELEERGWVERTPQRRVRIAPAVSEQFLGTFNVQLVERLLETAGRIEELLKR
jgi:hypothetical protein